MSPILRVFAGVIGAVGVLCAILAVVAWSLGVPNVINAYNIFCVLVGVVFAVYGISIAIRGKAPRGIVPWK